MKEAIIKRYVGETVSILLLLPKTETSKLNETYNGILKEVIDGVLVLDTNNPNFHIKKVVCKCDLVISVWIYRMEKYIKKI